MNAFQRLYQWFEANRDIAFDLLRIYLGLGLLVRGALYVIDPTTFTGLVDGGAPAWMTSPGLIYFVAGVHVVGGLMLTAGVYTRVAALAQIPILLGAVFLVHLRGSLLSANQSFEFSALVLFLLVLVFLHGAGRLSVDRQYRDGGWRAFSGLNDRLDDFGDVAFELLRIYLGVGLLVRGALVISNALDLIELMGPSSSAFLTSVALLHYVALSHLIGGFMIAVGLLTRVAAAIQIPALVGAVFLVHLRGGLIEPNQALEFSALVLFLLVLMVLHGSGRWSVDYYFERVDPEEERRAIEARRALRTGIVKRTAPAAALRKATRPKGLVCPRAESGSCPLTEARVPREHEWAHAEPEYSVLGSMVFVGGITAPPKAIAFTCTRCGLLIERSRDRAVLDAHRYVQNSG